MRAKTARLTESGMPMPTGSGTSGFRSRSPFFSVTQSLFLRESNKESDNVQVPSLRRCKSPDSHKASVNSPAKNGLPSARAWINEMARSAALISVRCLPIENAAAAGWLCKCLNTSSSTAGDLSAGKSSLTTLLR